ncbi:hypothetical protein ACIGD1_18435 [Streptomyces sp. NPDC085612]
MRLINGSYRNRMADDPHQGDDLVVVLSLMSAGRPEAGYGKRRRARA